MMWEYCSIKNWGYMIYPFSGDDGVTFTLTVDDIKNPSVITMTDNAEKANVITLQKEEILDPFDK